MKKRLIFLFLLLLVVIFIVWYFVCRISSIKPPTTLLRTASGVETSIFQLHDSVLFEAGDLLPRTGYDIQIMSEDGQVITKSKLSTDSRGQIPETIVWYDIGILPCLKTPAEKVVMTHLSEFEVSDMKYANRKYILRIVKNENIIRQIEFRVGADIVRPLLFASDARGCPKSGFLIGEEDVWVIGKNFPKGSLIRLWAVTDNSQWEDGNQLKEMTKQYDNELPALLELKGEETSFKKLLWPKGLTSIGSYDIVAEVITYPFGNYHLKSIAQVQNVVSTLAYSGFVVQRRLGIGEALEQDAAGVRMSKLAYRNAFLTNENVYVGVDPYVHPSFIGMTADVYIVVDKTDAQWTTDPSLVDMTGYVEQVTIQPGLCANAYSTLAWAAPLTPEKYDVVLDFNQDGVYSHGVDLIDSLDTIGFTVAEVRVDSISFNYSGSGAITIFDNINGSNISSPEYFCGPCDNIKPAAWIMGGSYSVQVNFKAIPSVNSAQIWAEGGMSGVNSSSSPVTVSFSGGSGQNTFTVNSVPNIIDKNEFSWNWNYKNVNGSSTLTQDMGTTGKHTVFTVFSTPNSPMAVPWLEALEYATEWASGESAESGVVNKIINGIYNSGMVYDGGGHHTTSYGNFNLTAVFNELRTPGFMVYMDCRDCANFFHVLTNALGFSHQYLRIPGFFSYKPMLPMGVSWTGASSCVSGGWSYHQVGWCGSHVGDASTKLNCTASLSTLILAICDISATDYINYLTNTAGISPGPTGICSPY